MDNPKVFWPIVGLVIGVLGVWQGPLEAFIVGLFGLLGWVIGKYLSGEIPLVDAVLERFIESRRGPR